MTQVNDSTRCTPTLAFLPLLLSGESAEGGK